MYSDIVPPKKNNSFIKEKSNDHEVRILKTEKIHHTIDRYHEKSKWPWILFIATVVILSIVYYSVFNNKTKISFESKSTIFEIKDTIPMILSEKNQSASTTLSYNLIYNNDDKARNVFAPIDTSSTTSTTTSPATTKPVVAANDYYVINNSSSTNPTSSMKIQFVNTTNASVQLVKNTRVDVNGTTYYLEKNVSIPKGAGSASSTAQYKIIGFKGTDKYEKFYAVDYVDTTGTVDVASAPVAPVDSSNVPNSDILSLIPENYIPLKKGYVYDKNINQTALVVVDKRDFERVLTNNSKLMQTYMSSFKSISDLVYYEININDYELVLDPTTGLPTSFKNLTIEIIPRINKDKVAAAFKGFSKDTMKKIKSEITKDIDMEVKYSPFWVNKVSDEDHINVEVK